MDPKTLKAGVAPREVWAWAAFDFANSGYTTVVLTAVFNAYFVSVVAGGAEWATFLWTVVIAASNAIGLFAMPAIAALADRNASKKRWLFAATLLCILGTVGLAFAGPGTIVWAALMVILSNLGYNVGETLNSAFLPELAREEAVGKVSGWGWSFGYCGGLVTLGLSLLLVTSGDEVGLGSDARIAGTMLITAAVFAMAALPLFLFVKERAEPRAHEKLPFGKLALESLRDVGRTMKSLGRFPDFGLLAVCGFCYQSGVSVVITLSAVYAAQVMGFTTEDTILMVFLVNITAAIGAFAFGYVQDRIGHKRALGLTLCVWLLMIVTAALASSQSAGRAMVAIFAPKKRSAEFYGLWNMALWLAAIVGPLCYGAVSWAAGNDQRLAIWVTGLFFLAALAVLRPMQRARGAAAAEKQNAIDEAADRAASGAVN